MHDNAISAIKPLYFVAWVLSMIRSSKPVQNRCGY